MKKSGKWNTTWRMAITLGAAVGIIVLAMAGCGKKEMEQAPVAKEPAPVRDINTVMAEHTPELMPIPGVVGIAIGQLNDSMPCILVLVENDSDSVVSKIPKTLEGYPTKIEVTGKIVPMDGK